MESISENSSNESQSIFSKGANPLDVLYNSMKGTLKSITNAITSTGFFS